MQSEDDLLRQQIEDAAHVFRAIMEAQRRGLRPLVLLATDDTNAFLLTARPKCNFEEVFDLLRHLLAEFDAGRRAGKHQLRLSPVPCQASSPEQLAS